ncbi:MAG: UbiA family prenyltransferase [Anaerocolumna sp.]
MIKKFFSYVELRTKITSLCAFLMTIAYLVYKGEKISVIPTVIFFTSMLLFDMTTTAINNYIDSKAEPESRHYKKGIAKGIIYILLGLSTGLGIYLAYLTDIVILLAGGMCFVFGVIYTYGPVPISRQPLGEILSGFFYGVMIPFIIIYINMPKGSLLTLSYSLGSVHIALNVVPLVKLLLFSLVPFCTTAAIMLANNICDVEKDIKVKRHTLPYYIGENAKYLFAILYYISYVAILIMVILNELPITCLLTLLTIFAVRKNIKEFWLKQEKSVTFVLSIKNYLLIMATNIIFICLGTIVF